MRLVYMNKQIKFHQADPCKHTIIGHNLMDQGEDTWCNVMGEVDGFRLGLTTHLRPLLQVSKQKPVGVAAQTLLSQAPLQLLWP